MNSGTWECKQMPNFWGNEDLCKLGKEYLNDLQCKLGPFCLQHSKTFDISQAFLRVTIAELSTLKQVWFFWPTLYIQKRICNTQWEVSLSKQVNYNQAVVKCQILQKCFLQNFSMQKFQNMEHSNSRTFKGLDFFQNSRTFKDFSRTLWTLFSASDWKRSSNATFVIPTRNCWCTTFCPKLIDCVKLSTCL